MDMALMHDMAEAVTGDIIPSDGLSDGSLFHQSLHQYLTTRQKKNVSVKKQHSNTWPARFVLRVRIMPI